MRVTRAIPLVSTHMHYVLISIFAALVLLPWSVSASPYTCVTTSATGATASRPIDSTQWNPATCDNLGPNGELSNLLSDLLADVPNMGNAANQMCAPVYPQCGCGMVPGLFGVCRPGPNKNQCPCAAAAPGGGVTEGICVANEVCLGGTYTDFTGATTKVGDLGGIVGDIFKGLLGRVMQNIGQDSGADGCTQYYTVTSTSSDPCAIYDPSLSGSILGGLTPQGSSTAQQLLDALLGGSQSSNAGGSNSGQTQSIGSQLLNLINNLPAGSDNQTGAQNPLLYPLGGSQGSLADQTVALNPDGTRGDIQILNDGATIFAGSRDLTKGEEIAGFYGGSSGGFGQPQGIAARMCQTRPWAESFISYVIPPSFFDGLCTWRGYAVGFPEFPASTGGASGQPSTSFSSPTTGIVSTSSVPLIQPKVEIWSVPSKVTIGARISIFWNTVGVSSCAVTSSDGSFSESSLSGGAATVPIVGPTTFTIRCITPNGVYVEDEVTVGLGV